MKKVDEDHRKQEEETKVEAVEDEPYGRAYEGFRHLRDLDADQRTNRKHVCLKMPTVNSSPRATSRGR